MTTRQFDRIYIFEEVGNAENKYVFTAPIMPTCTLYELFLKWCAKLNDNIKKDIDQHDLEIKMTTIMNELLYSSEYGDTAVVPVVIENSVYVGTITNSAEITQVGVQTPYFRGDLSVRPIHTLKEENDIRHTYQFSVVLLGNISDGFGN